MVLGKVCHDIFGTQVSCKESMTPADFKIKFKVQATLDMIRYCMFVP